MKRMDLHRKRLQLALQLLVLPTLLLQRRLGVKLRLGDFLDEDLAHLHIGDVAAIYYLFLDLLDELRLHRLALLTGKLGEVALVGNEAFEHRVVVDEVGVHLRHVLVVERQRGVLHLDAVTHLVVALHELPQLEALTVIRVLHNQVGALDGAVHRRAPLHDLAKRAAAQRHDQAAHAVDAHEGIHVVGVVLGEVLAVLHRHLDVVLDLLVRIADLAVHGEAVADLVARGPEDHVRALIHEGEQALDQVVYETVLIQVVGFGHVHVQDLGGVHAPVVRGRQELRVLTEMPHAVGRDFLGQRNRHHLFLGGDEAPRLLDDTVDGVERILDYRDPLPVDDLDQLFALLIDGGVGSLRQLEEVAEIPIVFLDGLHLLGKAAVQVLNGV